MKAFDPFAPNSPNRKGTIAEIIDPEDPSIGSFYVSICPVGDDAFLMGLVQGEANALEKVYGGKSPSPFILGEQGEAFQPTSAHMEMVAGMTVATREGGKAPDGTDCKVYDSTVWLRILYKHPRMFTYAMGKVAEASDAAELKAAEEKKARLAQEATSSTPLCEDVSDTQP